MSKTAAEAAKLGGKIKTQILQGPHSLAMRPFVLGFEDLPSRLAAFSRRLSTALDSIGKPGQKRKILEDRMLVEASEFVRVRTGQHYDEHLAELIQAVGMPFRLEELSGDAIRKKRKFLKDQYPAQYASSVRSVRRLSGDKASADSS